MRVAANLYPWDVDGDPAATGHLAALGLTEVTLAAAYHGVQALTPRHPRHRVVTRDAAAYYRTDPARWSGRPLRPAQEDPAGSFERAAAQLRSAGLAVNAWVVLTHNSRLGSALPQCAVRNAFGDSYPWALCAGSPAVRQYAATLAAEAAGLDDVTGIELEACGWYGAQHGGAHDKVGAFTRPDSAWLLSLCFCDGCSAAYGAAGADPAGLAARVRRAADGRDLLPADLAALVTAVRAQAAAVLLREVVGAVRRAAPGKQVLVHAHPDPRATGANPGHALATALAGSPLSGIGADAGQAADGVVLACWNPGQAVSLVTQAAAQAPPGARIAASLLAVAGLGGRPGTLAAQAEAACAAGATELRLYHAGLASDADLSAFSALCGALRSSRS